MPPFISPDYPNFYENDLIVAHLGPEDARLRLEYERQQARLRHLVEEHSRLRAERDHLIAERGRLSAERDLLSAERDALMVEIDRLRLLEISDS